MTDASWTAARVAGRLAVPGELQLTDSHLKFRATGMAGRAELAPFSVQLRHVAAIGIIESTSGLLRRRRRRLCVTLGDGSERLFDAPSPDEIADTVRARIGSTR